MRTATTLGKTEKGWIIISGPDVPADKQRASFATLGLKWPKDVDEVRYQSNDGVAKTKNKSKAEASIENMKVATERAETKADISKKKEAEVREAEKAKAESHKHK